MNFHLSMKRPLRIIPLLITFLLINLNICQAQEKSPLEVVNLFHKGYGGPRMDEIADYTTSHFRANKPKLVWVEQAGAEHFNIHKDPHSYVLQKLSSHDIVFLGTRHKKEAILRFVSGVRFSSPST